MTTFEDVARQHPHRTPNRAAQHSVRGGRLRPLGDRVLVRPDPRDLTRPSGLVLPDTADDEHRPQTGTVLAAGPDARDVTEGDRVLYRQWGGTEVEHDGELLLFLVPRDVFWVARSASSSCRW